MTVTTERKILLGFGAALTVMLFAGGAAWWNLQRYKETFRLVDHTHEVLHHLDRALTGILTMQTSTRGFVLTGDERMLAAHANGTVRVDDSLRKLRELTVDNPAQQDRLRGIEPVIERARAIMDGRIAARRARGLDSVVDAAAFLEGQAAVENFRDRVDAMASAERDLLHARVESAQQAGESSLRTIVMACTLATGFVVFAGFMVQHDFQRRRQAEAALQQLNDQLEHRVGERTAELAQANAAMSREIADRELARAELAASEQRLRRTLDSLLEGCQVISPDFRYVYLNDTATQHGRSTRAALLGRTMMECYPGIEQTAVYEAIRLCLEDRRPRRQEHLFTYPDGTQAWFRLGIQPAPEGVLVLSLDITEQKLHEERIRLDHAVLERRVKARTAELESVNRELEAFSYSVSHDLRAPLRHIDGFAGLLGRQAGAALDDKGRRFLATISSSARQMGRLIDDLLAFSRIGRALLHLAPVDHAALVAAVIAEGRYAESGRIIQWRIGALPTIPGDPSLLRQVWFNLIENAVKYSGKQPHAEISISAQHEIAKGEFVFTISDNGVGFDMTYADKLFGVFQRLHGPAEFEGTGIGLANVRRIIVRHGGRIWAEGHVGKGASFSFSLPDAPPASPSPALSPSASTPP